MDLSGLTEHLDAVEGDAALAIPYGGRTYTVRPPALTDGARCAALFAAQQIQDPAERMRAVEEALAGRSVAQLTLGQAVIDQMEADGVPAVVVRESGKVALIAWVFGPEAAERYIANAKKGAGDASGEARTPSRRRSKSTRGTGSASRTRTAPTSGTTSQSR